MTARVDKAAQKTFEVVFSRSALVVLVALLLGETTINYIDRQVVSVLAPRCGRIPSEQRAVCGHRKCVPCGLRGVLRGSWMGPRSLGVGRGLTLSILWWSIADMLTALARGSLSLGFFRGVLAIGEGGSWPAFAKATAKWVPMEARTLVIGICNSGSSLGS